MCNKILAEEAGPAQPGGAYAPTTEQLLRMIRGMNAAASKLEADMRRLVHQARETRSIDWGEIAATLGTTAEEARHRFEGGT